MDEELKLKLGVIGSMVLGVGLIVLSVYVNLKFLGGLGLIFIVGAVIADKALGFNMFANAARAVAGSRREYIPAHYKSELWRKQKGRCAMCGKKLDPHHYHIDHKKPVALGGKTTLSNLQLLCPECHMRKTKKDRLMISKAKKNKNKDAFDFGFRI